MATETTANTTVEGEISELVAQIRSDQQLIVAAQDRISRAKAKLIELLTVKGGGWKDDTGYARLTTDSIRQSYDSKALDALILSNPLQYGWIKDYRKETVVKGGVQVK